LLLLPKRFLVLLERLVTGVVASDESLFQAEEEIRE
jgi:hypothetical protein